MFEVGAFAHDVLGAVIAHDVLGAAIGKSASVRFAEAKIQVVIS